MNKAAKRTITTLLGIFILFFVVAASYPSFGQPHSPAQYNLVPTSDTTVQLTAEEREFLDSIGVIQVMVDEKFPPISYYDTEKKEFDGISIDVLKRLSEILGFPFHIIRDENLLWTDRLDMIKYNKVDLLCGASINEERKQYGYFTGKAYFEMNYALIGSIHHHIKMTDIKQIANYKIGLVEGMTINQYITDIAGPNGNITYYQTFHASLAALKKQEVNLVLGNEAVFTEGYFKGGLFDYEVVFPLNEQIKKYAFFFPRTDKGAKLAEILTKGMEQINLDEIINAHYDNKSIFAYYQEYTEKLQKANMLRNLIILFLLICSVSFLLIAIIIRNRNEELKHISSTDYLTGLKNRNALFQEFSDTARLADGVVCYVDLDRFKWINDNCGHEAGDMVLKEIARRLRGSAPKANIYRMGGDEFLIILDSAAEFQPEALLTQINQPITARQNTYQVSGSIGYVDVAGFNGSSLNELIHAADSAMLEAKALGKNRVIKYSGTPPVASPTIQSTKNEIEGTADGTKVQRY